jgi:hypothetical protein
MEDAFPNAILFILLFKTSPKNRFSGFWGRLEGVIFRKDDST